MQLAHYYTRNVHFLASIQGLLKTKISFEVFFSKIYFQLEKIAICCRCFHLPEKGNNDCCTRHRQHKVMSVTCHRPESEGKTTRTRFNIFCQHDFLKRFLDKQISVLNVIRQYSWIVCIRSLFNNGYGPGFNISWTFFAKSENYNNTNTDDL